LNCFTIRKIAILWEGKPREGDLLEDPGIDGSVILKWIFKTWDGGLRTERGGGRF
jgi:hypothetical protein